MRARSVCSLAVLAAALGTIVLVGVSSAAPAGAAPKDTARSTGMEALGKAIFFDKGLSANGNQSCASCHGPEVGFTGPDASVNDGTVVYEGSIAGAYGNRKPPAASYAGDSPDLHFDSSTGEWVGGMFWDGRATGAVLGDPLAEQAMGPFLNPMEQALDTPAELAAKVADAPYAGLFEQVWGPGSLSGDVGTVYAQIGRSVAAYERSAEVNPFTSKFDKFWDNAQKARKDVTRIRASGMGGMGGGGMMRGGSTDPNSWENFRGLGLTDTELQGLAVFNDPNRADCASCHSLTPGPAGRPLFTNFGYDNLGVPRNPENPASASDPSWADLGLGGYLNDASQDGKFKVPTLRNVDKRPSTGFVKAYSHNGYFKSLSEVVMFYAWRGMMMGGGMMGGGGMGGGGMMGGGMTMDMFPAPEVNRNLAPLKHFSMMDQANIVAFLKTLSDGHFVR